MGITSAAGVDVKALKIERSILVASGVSIKRITKCNYLGYYLDNPFLAPRECIDNYYLYIKLK